MLSSYSLPITTLSLWVSLAAVMDAANSPPYACAGPVDDAFVSGVWAKVVSQECLKCHKDGGDAEDSDFVLRDPTKELGDAREQAMRHNLAAFVKMAREIKDGESRLLLKAQGRIKHGGKEVVKPGSAASKTLEDYIAHVTAPPGADVAKARAAANNAPPFFDGIVMLDDQRLLRRATLSLAGRLPTAAELATIKRDSLKAMPALLDAVMKEQAFYDRLREGFNDIFLTIGADGNPDQNVLSYDHFPTRQWYSKYDLSHIADEKERRKAGYKMTDDYRDALRGEPMKLVEYIVRNDRPFTEIVTADYVMMSPYTSRGYGVFEEVKAQFKNTEDPFEYIPVRLKALKGRNKQQDQDSATGFYPHAGLLSTFQYLCRYPTTETNRNRLRARMYYQHFLGVDVLELAARVTDAAAVTAKYKVPTMEASECVVCHKTLDPVASLFQDYWRFAAEGIYGKRKGGWFEDMFQAGFEGEDMPGPERWRALQWLGEHTARDPRFAMAMVEHACYILTGRKALLPPKGLDDPLFDAKQRAYQTQRKQIEDIAARFAKNGFNFKNVLKDWIASDFYRADGIASAAASPERQAELDDIGIVRMLAPEQVERKVAAVFGRSWGRLEDQLAMLYGGIDSKEVTERAADPSGAMGAIQRIMSNDVACKEVALDFSRAPSERRLFPGVEPDVLPGASAEGDAKIRATMAHLHQLLLGRDDAADSPDVARTFQLFADIVHDATEQKHAEEEIYSCRYDRNTPIPDPDYTLRAWRAVVTYLLRRNEFLYE
ncbi:hypothetical protein AYO49_00665 [Verrucomicrobiaceae bacterium SCGC AG-212-N21]|nr:hypothetical protein AYO49_00665 [Verrucomicrobiaceae bacterium SCGC AG-212-N21]